MVIVPEVAVPLKLTLKPAGKPVAAPIPVAPLVGIVIFCNSGVPTQTVGFDDAGPAIMSGLTMIAAVVLEQPVEEEVKVNVADPARIALTKPGLFK